MKRVKRKGVLAEVVETVGHAEPRVGWEVRLHPENFLKVDKCFLVVAFGEVHLGHPN